MPKFRYFFFPVSLPSFSLKCHFAGCLKNSAVMCSCVQFLSVESGQHYKDDHIDLTKQSPLPSPDTAWQLAEPQQDQTFQTLDL